MELTEDRGDAIRGEGSGEDTSSGPPGLYGDISVEDQIEVRSSNRCVM